ncbi:MAG: hypothetical protein BWK76_23210 [Desulfobulbaceae bacterium A2]|nr:MAG: hypothetical protein BWK76_23210 [Desulfobulbaceae bacterium A2]
MRGWCRSPFRSPAEWVGLVAFALAAGLLCLHPFLSMFPLAGFLLCCLVAPLLPGSGFFGPVISRGRPEKNAVALTFDDGPDPETTPLLLELLARYQAPATFFVNGNKAARFPKIMRQLLAHGHSVGNHTYTHDNFIMLKSHGALLGEMVHTQEVLAPFGIIPHAFRPPVGVVSPRLAGVLRQTGMYAVNFSRRAGDRGNRRVRGIAGRILRRLRAGDIIMLHDTRPHGQGQLGPWLDEVEQVLVGIGERRLQVVSLAELIDRPVMSVRETVAQSPRHDRFGG